MIKIIKLSLLLTTCAISATVFSQNKEMNIPSEVNVLASYQASYTLFRKGSELGKGQRQLTKTDNGYSLSSSSNIKWLFLSDSRKENSVFTIEKDIITAQTYHYERTGTGRDREENIIFKPEKITTVYKNNKKVLKPIQLTFDPLLYQLALRKDLIDNKKILSYHMIRRGKETQYIFERLGTESVKTPIGHIDAIKLQRVRENSSRNTLIWVAPSLNYTVIKMTQFKDNQEQADLQLNWLHFDK
jgi:hypothetical protein